MNEFLSLDNHSMDKFFAIFGNSAAALALVFEPHYITLLGGAVVSCSTAFYFVTKGLHTLQRRRNEQELHDLKVSARRDDEEETTLLQ